MASTKAAVGQVFSKGLPVDRPVEERGRLGRKTRQKQRGERPEGRRGSFGRRMVLPGGRPAATAPLAALGAMKQNVAERALCRASTEQGDAVKQRCVVSRDARDRRPEAAAPCPIGRPSRHAAPRFRAGYGGRQAPGTPFQKRPGMSLAPHMAAPHRPASSSSQLSVPGSSVSCRRRRP